MAGGMRKGREGLSVAKSEQSLDVRKVEMSEGKPWDYEVSKIIDSAIRREISWPECRRQVAQMHAEEQLALELRLLDQAGRVSPDQ